MPVHHAPSTPTWFSLFVTERGSLLWPEGETGKVVKIYIVVRKEWVLFSPL